MRLTYHEFVRRYCGKTVPNKLQEWAIESFINDPEGQLIWTTGRANSGSPRPSS